MAIKTLAVFAVKKIEQKLSGLCVNLGGLCG